MAVQNEGDGPECIYMAKNVCGEGPVWDVEEQALYWVDIPEGKIWRRQEANNEIASWSFGTDIGAFALREKGERSLHSVRVFSLQT